MEVSNVRSKFIKIFDSEPVISLKNQRSTREWRLEKGVLKIVKEDNDQWHIRGEPTGKDVPSFHLDKGSHVLNNLDTDQIAHLFEKTEDWYKRLEDLRDKFERDLKEVWDTDRWEILLKDPEDVLLFYTLGPEDKWLSTTLGTSPLFACLDLPFGAFIEVKADVKPDKVVYNLIYHTKGGMQCWAATDDFKSHLSRIKKIVFDEMAKWTKEMT